MPDPQAIWHWLANVADPEIPVVSVLDLGIVRDVQILDDESVRVVIAPTYSGCPATSAIALDIETCLRAHGVENLHLETSLSPPWSSDWISAEGRKKLTDYGIAPPLAPDEMHIKCPRCASQHIQKVSQFGSTACKALYTCQACYEPFDYFKCHRQRN